MISSLNFFTQPAAESIWIAQDASADPCPQRFDPKKLAQIKQALQSQPYPFDSEKLTLNPVPGANWKLN